MRADRGRLGTPGGEETSGAAPRDGRQGADVGHPYGHKASVDPEKGVKILAESKLVQGVAQCLTHTGFIIPSWKTAEVGKMEEAQRRVWQRCEIVGPRRTPPRRPQKSTESPAELPVMVFLNIAASTVPIVLEVHCFRGCFE